MIFIKKVWQVLRFAIADDLKVKNLDMEHIKYYDKDRQRSEEII